jgi:hypothetical protein
LPWSEPSTALIAGTAEWQFHGMKRTITDGFGRIKLDCQ